MQVPTETPSDSKIEPRVETSLLDRPAAFLVCQLLLMVVMMHAGLTASFYQFDDFDFISPATKDDWDQKLMGSLIPVTMLSFRADFLIFKNFIPQSELNPRLDVTKPGKEGKFYVPPSLAPPMRFMNALYQMCAGMLLWLFLRRIRVPAGIAFLTALLWTGHPMNCENVCWIVERKGVLSALFGFAAMLAWTIRGPMRYLLLTLMYLLAYGSKPTALGLLPVFALLEVLVPRNEPFSFKDAASWRRLILTMIGPLAISLYSTFHVVGEFSIELVDPPGGTYWTALLTDFEILFRYIHHTLVPFRLTFFNAVEPIVSLGDPRLWIYGILVAGLFAGILWSAEPDKKPLALLGILWFLSCLAPNSNFIAIAYWFQDRYAVLSIPGLLLSVLIAAQGLFRRFHLAPEFWPRIGGVYAGLFVVLLAYRSAFYASCELLELDAARHQPGSAMARLQAAIIFADNMKEAGPGGKSPDPQAYRVYGKAAVFHYEGMQQCSDIYNFGGPFYAKLAAVEIMGQLGMHAEIKKSLEGWLPPKHLKMVSYEEYMKAKNEGKLGRQHFKRYIPHTLARAWAVTAESSLQLSLQPSVPVETQLLLLNQALQEAGESLKLPLNDESARLVQARTLLRISEIEAARNNMEVANKKYEIAVEVLKAVSSASRWRGTAETLLKNIRPPQPPKSPPQK